jgi:DNA-binding beta-propeller fold protein YncE
VTSGGHSALTIWDVSGSHLAAPGSDFKTSPEYNLDGVAVNPASGRVFIAGRLTVGAQKSSALWVFDGNTNSWLTPPFDLDSFNGSMPGVSFDPVQKRVYASSDFSDKVYVFEDKGTCP